MHVYRTHTCGELRLAHAGRPVRLSGWVHRKRDHGSLLFIDLRDHYGLTQCVIDRSSPIFALADAQRLESVITVSGKVVGRSPDTVNPKLPTGEIELQIAELTVQARPSRCRCRSTPRRTTRRISGSNTASSICAATAST